MSIVPRSRPQTSRDAVLSFIDDGLPLPPYPFLVGRRGFYGDSMGKPGANDLNIYDDALFLLDRDRMWVWNANCDPGKHRPGMANLKPGRWLYRPGIHNISKDPALHPHYEALVQAGKVTVHRDEQGDDTGFFGINIHRGGEHVTSSEGCQTIPPAQWPEVMPAVHRALEREGRTDLTYVLTSRYG